MALRSVHSLVAVAAVLLLVSCDRGEPPPQEPVQGIRRGVLTPGQLGIDTSGYNGRICIVGVGCVQNGQGTLTVGAGTHTVMTPDSWDGTTFDLGLLTIDAAGALSFGSENKLATHFETPAATESILKARTTKVSVDLAGHVGSVGFSGMGTVAPGAPTDVWLINGRRYHMQSLWAWDLDQTVIDIGSWGLRVFDDGSDVEVRSDLARTFERSGVLQLRARTTTVAFDMKGNQGPLALQGSAWLPGPDPVTGISQLTLLVNRRYSVVTAWAVGVGSNDTALSSGGPGFGIRQTIDISPPSPPELVLTNGTQNYLVPTPPSFGEPPLKVTAQVRTLDFDMDGYLGGFGLLGVGGGRGPGILSIKVMKGRRYEPVTGWAWSPTSNDTNLGLIPWPLTVQMDGTVELDPGGTDRYFEYTGPAPYDLKAKVTAVDFKMNGFLSALSITDFANVQIGGPIVHLLRGRRYQVHSQYAKALDRDDNALTSDYYGGFSVSEDGQSLVMSPQVQAFLSASGTTATLRTAAVTLKRRTSGLPSSICITGASCVYHPDKPLSAQLLMDRRYEVAGGGGTLTVRAPSTPGGPVTCSPSTMTIGGHPVDVECAELPLTRDPVTGPVPLVVEHTDKCLQANPTTSATIQATCVAGAAAQRWSPRAVVGGHQLVWAADPAKCLRIGGSSQSANALAVVDACSAEGVPGEVWRLSPAGYRYHVIAKHSGQCLDVQSGGTGDGTPIGQNHCHGGLNQRWALGSAAPPVPDVTAQGTIIRKVGRPFGAGSLDPEVIRNGVMPPVGTDDAPGEQFDTCCEGINNQDDDWIGYQFARNKTFSRVMFQEGMHFWNGGWFESLGVEVRRDGAWLDVANLTITPAYARGEDGSHFESYQLDFDAITGDAIRIIGAPGGLNRYFSVGELRVMGEERVTANAGPDLVAGAGGVVTLDGSASSSPTEAPLTFSWTQLAGPAVALGGASTAHPTFTAPGTPTFLTFSLTVTGGGQTSIADTVHVFVSQAGTRDLTAVGSIIARAPESWGAGTNIQVIRDGVVPPMGTADWAQQYDTYTGDEITEDWIGYKFATDQSFSMVFFQEGMHFWNGGWFEPGTLRVEVKQGASWVATSNLNVTPAYHGGATADTSYESFRLEFSPIVGTEIRIIGVAGGGNHFISVGELRVFGYPQITAKAGLDQVVDTAAIVTLDGTGSVNSDAAPLTYSWAQVAGSPVSLSGATTATPTFTAPPVDVVEELIFTLTVSNAGGASSTDSVAVVVRQAPQRDLTSQGSVIAAVMNPVRAPGLPEGGTIDEIRDLYRPAPDSTEYDRQYVTFTGDASRTEDWIGYQYGGLRTFSLVVFQAGIRFPTGGWFESMTVQVRRNGVWAPVSGLHSSPTYQGASGQSFQTYRMSFNPTVGDAIRLYGTPGGSDRFISVGEIWVFAAPVPVASAGSDFTAASFDSVMLDSSGSYSTTGNPVLTYLWTQTAGTQVHLNDRTADFPTFIAPSLNRPEELTFELVVKDGAETSPPDQVVVRINRLNEFQITTQGVISTAGTSPPGSGSGGAEVIRDFLQYPTGHTESADQFASSAGPAFSDEAWVGYEYTQSFSFSRLEFESGIVTSTGGWFDTLRVQIRRDGEWVDVAASINPPYLGSAGVGFEDYIIDFAPISGDGIRLIGPPGSSGRFVAVSELQVWAVPVPIVNAGPTQVATLNERVVLDGGLSRTGFAGGATYSWIQQPGVGPTVVLENAVFERASFVVPAVGRATDVAFWLTICVDTVCNSASTVVTLVPAGGRQLVDDNTVVIAGPLASSTRGSGGLEVIHDGIFPPVSSTDLATQFDNFRGGTPARQPVWIGYEFDEAFFVSRVLYQQGVVDTSGGWFDSLRVEVRQGKDWMPVTNQHPTPPFAGGVAPSFTTYRIDFEPILASAIRIIGVSGGSMRFFSIGELQVFGAPWSLGTSFDVDVVVRKPSPVFGGPPELVAGTIVDAYSGSTFVNSGRTGPDGVARIRLPTGAAYRFHTIGPDGESYWSQPQDHCDACSGAEIFTLKGLAFEPIRPASCPGWTEVGWTYDIGEVGRREWLVPSDPTANDRYVNNVDYHHNVVANEFVTSFGMRFDRFDLPAPDSFIVTNGVHSTMEFSEGFVTDPVIPTWRDFQLASSEGRRHSLETIFFSDTLDGGTGMAIGHARVCSAGGAPNSVPFEMEPTRRYSGVLLGQNDVVYFEVPVGSQKPGDVCSSAHDTFALWGSKTRTEEDFDLYVRCNEKPTAANALENPALYGNRTPPMAPAPPMPLLLRNQEFVHAPANSCPCGGKWVVAVHSKRGQGQFNLVNHKHYANEHRGISHWASECLVPEATLRARGDVLLRGYRRSFGANEGARFYGAIEFRNGLGVTLPGDVPIPLPNPFEPPSGTGLVRCVDARSHSDACTIDPTFGAIPAFSRIELSSVATPLSVAHEMGHHFDCLFDEYVDLPDEAFGGQCGHSIMSTHNLTKSNYCYCNHRDLGEPHDPRCAYDPAAQRTHGDHGWDPDLPGLGLDEPPAWERLQSRSPVKVTTTPDNFNYEEFDFGGLYAPLVVFP
jgi:hypothetical protein